ncbi:hypothetical protein [Streptomyces subrutilus]|uniref:hypothetical protein n=1 Tax=Streptomyces subrutilus TaxID=36818 RepID=UPI0033C756DB
MGKSFVEEGSALVSCREPDIPMVVCRTAGQQATPPAIDDRRSKDLRSASFPGRPTPCSLDHGVLLEVGG